MNQAVYWVNLISSLVFIGVNCDCYPVHGVVPLLADLLQGVLEVLAQSVGDFYVILDIY